MKQEWQLLTFKDIANDTKYGIVDGPFGSNLKTSDYVNKSSNTVPVLTTKNLTHGYDEQFLRYISKGKFETLKRSAINPDDIIVAKIGSCGKSGIYPKGMPTGIIPANLLKITVNEDVHRDFVYYYIKSPKLLSQLKGIIKQTAQPAFNVTQFRKLEVPVPPLSTQKKIASKIDTLFAKIDSGTQSLEKAKRLLEKYRQSVLKHAFEGKLTAKWREENKDKRELPSVLLERIKEERKKKLGKKYKELPPVDASKLPELPEGWMWCRLGEVSLLNHKPNLQNINEMKNFDFIPMRDVECETGNINLNEKREFKKVKKGFTSFSKGDVLFAKITPCMENGKIAIAKNLSEDFGFGSTEFHVFSPLENYLNREYLFQFLVQKSFRKVAKRNMTGTAGQLRISKDYLENYIFPLPTSSEQKEIIVMVKNIYERCDFILNNIKNKMKNIYSLKNSILKSAFEGKLIHD